MTCCLYRPIRALRLSAVLREALIRFLHGLLAVGALEATNGKVTSRHLLEMLDERIVHGSASERADERNGLSRELLRDNHSEAGCDLGDEAHENRPPSSITPRSTTNRAACVTLFASMPRTAKYPLSEASAESGRPPNANTCTHDSAASGSDRFSPSLR